MAPEAERPQQRAASTGSSHPLSRHLPQVIREAGNATTSAVVGLFLGGPVGAIVGAATGVAAQGVVDVIRSGLEARARRAANAFDIASQIITEETTPLDTLLLRDENRLELALEALEAAATCPFEERIEAFAAAIATIAICDDKKDLSRIHIVVRALSSLDDLHVVLLSQLAKPENSGGLEPEEISSLLNVPTVELRPVVRLLELHGLIIDAGRFEGHPLIVRWQVSELGQLCLDLIDRGGHLRHPRQAGRGNDSE